MRKAHGRIAFVGSGMKLGDARRGERDAQHACSLDCAPQKGPRLVVLPRFSTLHQIKALQYVYHIDLGTLT